MTPQQVEDLRSQIVTYCGDNDPRSLLNMGTLSLTKIKESFKIFKSIVWDSKKNGGGNNSGGSSNGPEKNELLQQIKDLQGCLLQRDNEIAILVNMVKKGKTASDVQSAVSSAGGTRPLGNVSASNEPFNKNKVVEEYNAKENHSKSMDFAADKQQQRNEGLNHQPIKPRPKSPSGPAVVQLAPKEEKLVQRHLFGISPPENRKILEDAGGKWWSCCVWNGVPGECYVFIYTYLCSYAPIYTLVHPILICSI